MQHQIRPSYQCQRARLSNAFKNRISQYACHFDELPVIFKDVEELVNEVRLTFHAFAGFARIANGDRLDPSGRAVAEYLSKNHPTAVPEIARTRGVTRQHIQTIVNEL